jgi:hypothetical protein
MHSNRANLLARLEQFERELAAWKRWLMAEGEELPLEAAITDSHSERAQWYAQAKLQDWTNAPEADVSTQQSGGLLRQMFFGSWGSKKDPAPGSGNSAKH